IASTATIARLMASRVRTGQVFEHHNALGRLHMAALEMPTLPRPAHAPLNLYYASGTKAHKEDFHEILEPALAEILRRHPGKVEVQLIGHFGKFTHLDPAADPVEIREPIWDFDAFCRLVARADINLSVLSRSLLTDAKSEIKWMEAAMFAVPSVVSDTATHCEVIEDGHTGILAPDMEGFVTGIERLVTDEQLRTRLGETARKTVLHDYQIARMGRNLHDMFTTLRPEEMQKTRLVVVNVFYPPQAIGGATRVVHDNVRLLRENYGTKYEIDVICTLEGGSDPLSVTTDTEDSIRVWAITIPAQPKGEMTPRDPMVAEVFERLISQLNPDLIHFHCVQRLTASVVDIARLRKIPYLITLHDGWWISPNQFIIDERDRIEVYDYRRQDAPDFPQRALALVSPLQGAARLLAVSAPFADLHRDCGLDNIEVTENGVSALPTCIRRPSPSGRVRLAHIGGASRHKGFHLVRNALLANSYSNLEFLLVDHALAPGTEIQEVWGTTPVTRMAKVPQSDIAELYERIDILLAPSIWPESYGLVTREAMACGVWVITSDRGAIGADIEDGVNGHLVEVSTYEGLARSLWTVDRDPARYLAPPQIRAKPRQAYEQVTQLATIYDAVLSEHGMK
ncbi:MAG: glycosyltransferase, partial [Allgaiera sp.]|nr:glycosyltransferase [Allgaiera sp.]